MPKVKCPYFFSRTNGKKLYINCSLVRYINESSLRKEFDYAEARKVCYEVNCCNDYLHCSNYLKLLEQTKEIKRIDKKGWEEAKQLASITFEDGAQFVTIENCQNFYAQGIETVVNDGKAVTFVKE